MGEIALMAQILDHGPELVQNIPVYALRWYKIP
jgi:hypothetical protein